MKIRAHKNNKIVYGQDFCYYKGLPSDIVFDTKVFKYNSKNEPEQLVLEAYGYGQLDPYNNKSYGDGKIYLSLCFLNMADRVNIINKVKEENNVK
jgi:hypothetical protein